jgi:membrane-associated phospholipid phosphatase
VFGAMPSLHVSFPAAALAAAWHSARAPERAVHLGLTVWMLVASVYLDHHWLVDGALTLIIVATVYALLRRFWPSFDQAPPFRAGPPA